MATTPTPSFWEYIVSNIPNHLKVLLVIGVVVGGWVLYNHIVDMQKQLDDQKNLTATLNQKFTQIGTTGTAISSGNVEDHPQIDQTAVNELGVDVTKAMAAQNSTILALGTAVGNINEQISNMQKQPATVFTPTQQTPTGAITNFPLEETRTAGPGLTSLHLYYDPTQKDPTKAFGQSYWDHYNEKFSVAVGEWQKAKSGGLQTTVKLQRTVSHPDPTDPSKTIVVGTEDIPLINAETTYSPEVLAPLTVPRWTFSGGLSTSGALSPTTTPKYNVLGLIDYRLTDKYGIFVGTAGGGVAAGVSIRLDSGKK